MKDSYVDGSNAVINLTDRSNASARYMPSEKPDQSRKAGNVVFLKTLPPCMQSVDHVPLDRKEQERLNLELNCFCVSLLMNGRPGKERFVRVVRGHTIEDLVAAGASIKLAPWSGTKDDPFPKQKLYEAHGEGVSGWWSELQPGVLAYLSFSGLYGLEAHDIACLLAESQFPDPDLIEWADESLRNNLLNIDNVAAVIPESACQYLGNNFRTGQRILRLANDSGTDDKALFSAYEYSKEMDPVLN